MKQNFHERFNKQNINRGLSYLKRNGVLQTVYKVLERLSRDRDEAGYQEQFIKMQAAYVSEKQKFTHRYKISILVPT